MVSMIGFMKKMRHGYSVKGRIPYKSIRRDRKKCIKIYDGKAEIISREKMKVPEEALV